MAYRLMYITNDDTQNYPFCRLKLVVEMLKHSKTNQNSLKCRKLLGQQIRKGYK